MSGRCAVVGGIARTLAVCGIVAWASSVAAQAPVPGADASDGWAGKIVVRPAPAPDPKRRPAAAPPAETPVRGTRAPPHARRGGAANAVVGYSLAGDRARSTIHFALGGPTEAHARSLSDPPRVIVDLPETEFRLPPGAGQQGHGLVSAFRFGLIEAGKSRIVLDTVGPVRVARTEVVLDEAGGAFRLEIELAPTTVRELAAIELAEAALSFRPAMPEPQATERRGLPARPVIVVDAGHGGIDPGAAGARIAEKDLVLSVARHIERALNASGRYEVAMTRTRDVFVSLDERVAISRRHNADLFVSVHADSLPVREAARAAVRGATVYTLAEQASDDLARRAADKENAVDLLAGLPVSMAADDQVRDILVDLMRRETLNYASEFRQLLVGELSAGVLMARDPKRSGPFKVLRQPASPSVLVELGYISNVEDERVMLQPDWQAKVAAAVGRAVDEHFRQRKLAGR